MWSWTWSCCAALGKSLYLSGPQSSPLKHSRHEVRPGLALKRGHSLPWGKTRGCTWAIFEIICFIPRQVIKNIIFMFSEKQLHSAAECKTPMNFSD